VRLSLNRVTAATIALICWTRGAESDRVISRVARPRFCWAYLLLAVRINPGAGLRIAGRHRARKSARTVLSPKLTRYARRRASIQRSSSYLETRSRGFTRATA
jgi:hypothetical protein